MSVLRYCGLILLASFIAMLLSELNGTMARLARACVGACIFCALVSSVYPSVKLLRELICETPLADTCETLFKALGVALAVEVCADACRDAGESSLASKLELVGKAELILLAIPLVRELMECARGLLL